MNIKNTPQENGENFLNPFPATAVARLAKGAKELLTIETEAFIQLKSQINDYLIRKDDYGKTICIVGEYGTGKTHLALEVLSIIEELGDKTLHSFYLDAPSDNFLELYRKRFLPKLNRTQVLTRLDECYADVVAAELENDEIYFDISSKLKRREISAFDVVRKLGLMESKIQRQFEERLKHITEDPCFSMAFTLFHEPEFETFIWDWFNGKAPDKVLKERGITKTIDTDALALETIGVLAFLFGQQGHRFILMIDELEKVFSSTGKHFPNEATMLAFKKLFEAIGKTKALLVLSGLPEFYEALPLDAQQRISALIHPSSLTTENVIAYIRRANKKLINNDVLKPFSTEIAQYISSITGGNARKVVRICYHAFQNALIENKLVTRQIVEDVAQEQFGGQSKEDVHSEILQVIERRGWLFESEKIFEDGNEQQKAKLFLPISEGGDGIALTIVQDIFSKEDCAQIIRNTTFLKKESKEGIRVASVLVVGGYLADNLLNELNESFNRVIIYKLRHFKNDLDSALTGLRIKIEERSKENDIAVIKKKLEQLDRQYRSLRDIIRDELPTKRDLITSIQFALTANSGYFKKNLYLSAHTENVSAFYPIFTLFEELDSIITNPFYKIYFMRFRKSMMFETLYRMKSGPRLFGQFYLLLEMIQLFYDLIAFPEKFRIIDSGVNKFNIEKICQVFDKKIISPLINSTRNNELEFKEIFLNSREFIDNVNNSNIEEIDFMINGLVHKLKSLPQDVLWKYENRFHPNELKYNALPGFESTIKKTDQISISQFPELNEIFTRTWTILCSIDNIIKETIAYTVFAPERNILNLFESNSKIDKTPQLSEFYFLKKMVFIFMDVINRNVNSWVFLSRRAGKELMRFCEEFDHEILGMGMKR
jgi:Cdc6-like AAA superfamily ATPase